MHYVGVVFAGEDVPRPAHVCGELIDLVEASIDHQAAKILSAQIANGKVVGRGVAEFRKLKIDTSNPKAFQPSRVSRDTRW